jgi:hypothetical protein
MTPGGRASIFFITSIYWMNSGESLPIDGAMSKTIRCERGVALGERAYAMATFPPL